MSDTLSEAGKKELLRLAREAIICHFKQQPPPTTTLAEPLFQEYRGVFVTLMNHGELRGCIGTFVPDQPLGQIVCQYAVVSLRDSRFRENPVTLAEVPELDIGISILSELEVVPGIEAIQLGVHGIRVSNRGNIGCFLPEVAQEQGWNVQQFVEHCLSHKAQMDRKSWQDPNTKIEVFTTLKLKE